MNKSHRVDAALTPNEREDYEERAAILEYEANLPRVEAERLALAMVRAARRLL